jgi:penicillin amidase
VMAHGVIATAGMAAMYGPLARYAFDVGNWEGCRWAVFHGVSGHPGSAHYSDQNAAWSDCAMVPMRYGWAGIEAEAETSQRLVP